MGKANRERRQRKEQARRRARSSQTAGAGSGSGSSYSTSSIPGWQAPPPAGEELALTLVHQGLLAACHGDTTRFALVLTELVAPRDPRWPRAVDQALNTVLTTAVADLWRSGWQPADLLRAAARKADAAQQRLLRATMAAELAGYAAATLDPRWAAQLTEGAVEVWWEPRLTAVQACSQRHDGDRTGFVRSALDLLHTLAHLPPLELLGPVPGTATPEPKVPHHRVDERVLARVRAFLAKAESTPYPAEAETFTAAAQALMARHSIDHALLAATGRAPADQPTARRVGVDNPYEAPKVTLLDAIASANRCRTVWSKEFGFVSVVGYPTDLDTVELLFTSLLVQATTAMTREGSRLGPGGRSRTRSFRQSFLLSYGARIRERLAEATREQTEAAAAEPGGNTLLPVLAARTDAVDQATEEMFPNVTATSAGHAWDGEGWSSGRAAADLAVLNPATPVTA